MENGCMNEGTSAQHMFFFKKARNSAFKQNEAGSLITTGGKTSRTRQNGKNGT